MARFVSELKGLTLQDADGVWAQFSDGAFATDDKSVAARLRKVEYVTEEKSATTAAPVKE